MSQATETFTFKSEAKQLLDLMIHSLYSTKEVFLRELVSNASDALDKLRFLALTDPSLRQDDEPLRIRLKANPDTRTLTITDNGVGMSRAEAIENLGTIAHSGTKEFATKLAAAKAEGSPEALIGQFGVGFYSSFMVADEVYVLTRKAGEAEATLWRSRGDGQFQVEAATRDTHGTTITLHLRPADEEDALLDFTQEWAIRQTIKKYSDFVQYPIELEVKREEVERDEEGQPKEGVEPKVRYEWQTLNSMKAIWTRNPSEVKAEEYNEFYKHIARDWEDPFETLTLKAEGTFEYQALLFIPKRPPFDLFYRDQKFGLQLYVNRVLIMERSDELLPDWLRFVKGVVDSPDLSLNVSREMLQQDKRVAKIKERIIKKVVDTLAKIQKDAPERYKTFWDAYGKVLKEGLTDYENGSKLHPLLWFQSSHHETELTSLADYVARMKEGQEAIYYLTGESRTAVERSPHLEAFKDKGYEVLYLVDPVDEIIVGHLPEFDGKKLKSVGKGTVELGSEEERKQAEAAREEKEKAAASLLERLKRPLEAHVKEVRLSTRLTRSAVCLVGDEFDLSPGLERMLKQANQKTPGSKRILELNPDHPLMGKLTALYEADPEAKRLDDYAQLLLGQAYLVEGSPLPDPVAFAGLVAELMVG